MVTILIFGIAAVLHAVGYWAVNPNCDVMPTLRWHILMAMVMVFEDLLKSIYRWMRRGHQGERRTDGWSTVFGYIWVWSYLAWSLPKLMFPEIDCKIRY